MTFDKKAALESVVGTLALEGLELSDTMLENVAAILDGHRSADDVVAEIIAQHRATAHAQKVKTAIG